MEREGGLTAQQKNSSFYVEKDWGWEIWFENCEKYCGKEIFVLYALYSSKGKFHYHKKKTETFYVIQGTLKLDYIDKDGQFRTVLLSERCSFKVEPYTKHRFTAFDSNGCNFIEASTYHEESDSYRCYFDEKTKEWIDV
jgi:mannose-6-phosphate isomerase-like protein (cupin superfamily)